jgi:hypothetical protein
LSVFWRIAVSPLEPVTKPSDLASAVAVQIPDLSISPDSLGQG